MHLTSAVICLEKNTQTLLIVNIALAVTQHSLKDFNAALDSKQHALDIRLKLFGGDHACTASSFLSHISTQFSLTNDALDYFFTALI